MTRSICCIVCLCAVLLMQFYIPHSIARCIWIHQPSPINIIQFHQWDDGKPIDSPCPISTQTTSSNSATLTHKSLLCMHREVESSMLKSVAIGSESVRCVVCIRCLSTPSSEASMPNRSPLTSTTNVWIDTLVCLDYAVCLHRTVALNWQGLAELEGRRRGACACAMRLVVRSIWAPDACAALLDHMLLVAKRDVVLWAGLLVC